MSDFGEDMRSDLATALLIERLVRDAYSDRAPGAVTPLQWAILRAVSRARPEDCNQNWIAGFVGVTAGPANRAIKALERHKAVTIERDPQDARKTIIALTPAGKMMLDQDPILRITRKLAKLETHKKVEFRSMLQQLFLASAENEREFAEDFDRR